MADQEQEQVNILLVDDQPAKLLSYEAILGELGENLIKTNSGDEALQQLLKTDIAVVLVDVCMPRLDGFELAAMIRQHPRFQKTAIILVSAVMNTDIDRLKGYDSGAMDYVSVPIIPEVLRAKVAVFADLYRKTRQLEKLNRELEERVQERTAALESSTARLKLAIEGAGMATWDADLLTGKMFWSDTHFRLFGYEPVHDGEATEEMWRRRIHPDDLERVLHDIKRTYCEQSLFSPEMRIVRADDHKVTWLAVYGRFIYDDSGKANRFVGIAFDITERKEAEQAKAVLLQSERAARNEAERATRSKDEFLACLSHELRTPLNSILGWSQILRRGRTNVDQVKKGLETIERNARVQSQLVDDLFDMNRIVSGKMRLEASTVDLCAVIDAAFETVRPVAEAREIRLRKHLCEGDCSIQGDPDRLQQIVCNLMSNAIKFTPSGGEVDVVLRREKDVFGIDVADTGQGIAPDFLPFVFDRFRQADSSMTRKFGGLGLGLTIVKHLTELHGGSVAVQSRGLDQGSTFTVSLPMGDSVVQSESHAPGARALRQGKTIVTTLRGLKVLAVDDEEDARMLIHRVLEEFEAEVLTAASAREALQILKSKNPDLLVCDISMPDMDGFELMKEIRCGENASKIPAVALTAFARSEDRQRALDAGFEIHLAKPVEPYRLIAVLHQLMSERLHRLKTH